MVCRVCLNKSEFEINIFNNDSLEQPIADVIKRHFWFTPSEDDTISSVICLECWKIIREFNEFYETIRATHELYYEQKGLPNEIVENSKTVKIDNFEQIHEYEDIEPIIDIYADNDQQDRKDGIKEIDALAENSEQSADEISNDNDEDQDYKPEPEEMRKRNKPLKKCLKKKITKHAPKKVNVEKKDGPKVKKENLWSNEKSLEIIRKHLNLNCDICSFPTGSFGELEKHFKTTHVNTKAYIQCCGRRYNKIQRVAQHAYMHEDPNSFQCDVCYKSFSSAYYMRSHKVQYHPSEDQLKFQCDQCEKRFPLQHLLDYHKATHVPVEERSHLCTHCQKLFASDHLLKAHISMRHKNAANVCHICAKTIRDKQHFKKHMKEHFEEAAPRVKCPHPGCDKYLKDEENLKVHLRRHNPKNLNFACDLCGKVLKNRMALTSHKLYTHAEKQFFCNLCPKSFKRQITLKEHLAFHTGEALYKCPFCERTFNSNANMHSHKKKQHPVEWEHWRKTKTQSAQVVINTD